MGCHVGSRLKYSRSVLLSRKEEGCTVTRKTEEERLIKRSHDFLETAEYQTSKGFYDLATFSLEQALQLFLKARVLAEGVDYPRTHSVRTLLEILSELVPENRKPTVKRILENRLLELGMLEDAYITSRYVMREFTKQEAEKLTKTVKKIMQNVP
jgi:HEPN domain-containing protein